MALFESGNPTLSEKIFSRSLGQAAEGQMTVRGSMQKFGFLMLMVVAGAGYTWKLYFEGAGATMMTFLMVGLFGGLVVAIVMSFKPEWSKYLAPAYGVLEGFFLGGISAFINDMMKEKYPNIVLSAVLLTIGVAFAVFLLYNFRIIRATEKFKSVIFSSIVGIMIFYLINMLLGVFGVHIPFMQFGDSSLLGIGINLFIVAIAALSLVLNFDQIETGEQMGAPKFMEWYSAYGLLVTLVWLYLEILKLLARFSNNRN